MWSFKIVNSIHLSSNVKLPQKILKNLYYIYMPKQREKFHLYIMV
jgi:hypothetical protein